MFCDDCPDGWTEVDVLKRNPGVSNTDENGFPKRVECIKQIQNKTTWYQAKAICMSEGSHLLELNSPFESDQVARRENSKNYTCRFSAYFDFREMRKQILDFFRKKKRYCEI